MTLPFFVRILVLRGFPAAAYRSRFAGTENLCAALIWNKINYLLNGNATCVYNPLNGLLVFKRNTRWFRFPEIKCVHPASHRLLP